MKAKFSVLTASLLSGIGALFFASEGFAQTTPAPKPTVCSRSCWGARAPGCSISSMAGLSRAIIHHTASSSDYTTDYATAQSKVRGVQNYHMDVNGWCDIGYHWLVSAGGHIFEGRSGSMSGLPRGAHDGCNTDSFGFNVMGYYHSPYNQTFTAAAQDSLYDVIAWRMPSGWSPYGSGTYCGNTVGKLDGHRKVLATACPGDIIWAHIGTSYTGGNARNGVASRRTPSTSLIVDNAGAGFSIVGAWSTGSSSTDKYGADYRYHSTEAVSEPATWTTTLGSTKTWSVYAWWPQGSNRSTTAPYIVYHDAGSTTVNKNQQANGGAWNLLGSWTMSAGTAQTKLSCWTTTGFVVVADAVKWQ